MYATPSANGRPPSPAEHDQRNNCQHPSPRLQTPSYTQTYQKGWKKMNISHANQKPRLVSGAINQPLDLNTCTTFMHPIQDAQHSITGMSMLQHLPKASSTRQMEPACRLHRPMLPTHPLAWDCHTSSYPVAAGFWTIAFLEIHQK